jgi:hypothetical protein
LTLPSCAWPRNGITLRYRTGEDGPPWMVKLPEGSSSARSASTVHLGRFRRRSAIWCALYTVRPLVPVARLQTDRTPIEIRGPDGGTLAEITDDRVAAVVEGLIRRPWRQLKRAAKALRRDSPDTEWHAVWILAKRCRYAAEAIAPVFGRQAGQFAAAIAAVRDVLGDHQDTEAWLRAAGAALSPVCLAAGELIAAERREPARLRSRWAKIWKRARAKKLRPWL